MDSDLQNGQAEQTFSLHKLSGAFCYSGRSRLILFRIGVTVGEQVSLAGWAVGQDEVGVWLRGTERFHHQDKQQLLQCLNN